MAIQASPFIAGFLEAPGELRCPACSSEHYRRVTVPAWLCAQRSCGHMRFAISKSNQPPTAMPTGQQING
jgi:ribosomal protein L37AE/L43A